MEQIDKEYLKTLSLSELKELLKYYSDMRSRGSVMGGRELPKSLDNGSNMYEREELLEEAYWEMLLDIEAKLFGSPSGEFTFYKNRRLSRGR